MANRTSLRALPAGDVPVLPDESTGADAPKAIQTSPKAQPAGDILAPPDNANRRINNASDCVCAHAFIDM